MSVPDYTVVIAVDARHLSQLALVWSTWIKHKTKTITEHPLLVIYDKDSVKPDDIAKIVGPDHPNVTGFSWPPDRVFYEHDSSSRFGDCQRYRMLAGFVHATAEAVKTPYYLKLDLDVVATGNDNWIDPEWFEGQPGIISHPWGYTKPKDQPSKLDQWVANNPHDSMSFLSSNPPLNLPVDPESNVCRHKRIISWCGFFHTGMTRLASQAAEMTCGKGKLPVPSQDGFLYYVARRGGFGTKRIDMKSKGWTHCSNERSIRQAIEEMNNGKSST